MSTKTELLESLIGSVGRGNDGQNGRRDHGKEEID